MIPRRRPTPAEAEPVPELPEVETTRRGIAPHVVGQRVADVRVRQRQLRWPVPTRLRHRLAGRTIDAVDRRAKYLLLRTGAGTLIVHLGMSGSLRLDAGGRVPGKHDHWDIELATGRVLRFTDPRRFGSLHLTREPDRHPLLASLGPEPLDESTDGDYLYRASRGRRVAVKHFLVDSQVIAGVGNIYACEALFRAGIHPARAAGRISAKRHGLLAGAVKSVLSEAIAAGGTTLRDFLNSDGQPGYFMQDLAVYGLEGEPCPRCRTPVRRITQGQRGSWYCPRCQT